MGGYEVRHFLLPSSSVAVGDAGELTTNVAPVGTELFDDPAIPVIDGLAILVIQVIQFSQEILLLSPSFLLVIICVVALVRPTCLDITSRS